MYTHNILTQYLPRSLSLSLSLAHTHTHTHTYTHTHTQPNCSVLHVRQRLHIYTFSLALPLSPPPSHSHMHTHIHTHTAKLQRSSHAPTTTTTSRANHAYNLPSLAPNFWYVGVSQQPQQLQKKKQKCNHKKRAPDHLREFISFFSFLFLLVFFIFIFIFICVLILTFPLLFETLAVPAKPQYFYHISKNVAPKTHFQKNVSRSVSVVHIDMIVAHMDTRSVDVYIESLECGSTMCLGATFFVTMWQCDNVARSVHVAWMTMWLGVCMWLECGSEPHCHIVELENVAWMWLENVARSHIFLVNVCIFHVDVYDRNTPWKWSVQDSIQDSKPTLQATFFCLSVIHIA